MTVSCARFFAADWEAQSFLEFFVDLQLRVEQDKTHSLGRTNDRLADHARFALQMVLVRSVDSYIAYVAEVDEAVSFRRRSQPWQAEIDVSWVVGQPGTSVDADSRYSAVLAHGNVRQMDRLFERSTRVKLFTSVEDVERIGRLISIRNLISHGRTFAADDLVSAVEESVSVGGLGLRLKDVRKDLAFLRASVVATDEAIAVRWQLARPVTRQRLYEAIEAASNAGRHTLDPEITVPPERR